MPREVVPTRPTHPVASFRPSTPGGEALVVQTARSALREIELPAFRVILERMLASSGLPEGCVTGLDTIPAMCRWHSGRVRFNLHLPDGHGIRVTHCGCADWRKPDAAPPEDIDGFATSLADHVVWYWHNHADFMVMDHDIAAACEREAAKDRAQGLSTTFAGPRSVEFDTFLGRDQGAAAFIDMLHDSLLRQRWRRSFNDAADVTRFFRSMRPYLRSLAESRDRYAANGADGAIKLTLASLRYLGLDALPIIAELAAAGGSKRFDIDGARLLLRWRYKMIQGTLSMPDGIEWPFGTVDTFREMDGRRNLIATQPSGLSCHHRSSRGR